MDHCQGVSGQLWKAVPAGGGYFFLKSQFLENENKCLEGSKPFAHGDPLNGAARMDPCGNFSGQMWKLIPQSNGYYQITNAALEGEHRCLESSRPDAAGDPLRGAARMDPCGNFTGQLWKLVSSGQPAPPSFGGHPNPPPPPPQSHNGGPSPGKYVLRSDTGRLLARCNGCVPRGAYPDSAFVHESNNNASWGQWWLEQRHNGRWVLRSDTGRYLARCNGCVPGGAYPDSAFVHESNADASWAQWSIERRPNGRYALRSDNGRYLARCNGCIPGGAYPDSAFVHESNPDASWAQWSLEPAR